MRFHSSHTLYEIYEVSKASQVDGYKEILFLVVYIYGFRKTQIYLYY